MTDAVVTHPRVKLWARPMTRRTSVNSVIENWHRHADPVPGYRFAIGAVVRGHDGEGLERLCGVAVVSWPTATRVDGSAVAVISRLVTDGTYNACSFLYGRCCRAAKAMGFRRIVTFTLETEPGTSLRAAGFTLESTDAGRGSTWKNRAGRKGKRCADVKRLRWAKAL